MTQLENQEKLVLPRDRHRKKEEQSDWKVALKKLESIYVVTRGKDAKIDLASKYAANLEEEMRELDSALKSDNRDDKTILLLYVTIRDKIVRLNEILHMSI